MAAVLHPVIALLLFAILAGLIGYLCLLFVYWRTKE
jgi:hypothetical protein